MDSRVSTEWLSLHPDDQGIGVLDRTVAEADGGFDRVSGRGDYERGDIPTAGFAGLGAERVDVAVYTASLQQWAADPANPMVAGTPCGQWRRAQ